MRLTALLGIAAVSCVVGGVRPHYGGALRIETRISIATLDPAELEPGSPAERFSTQVFETLTVLDEHDQVRPWLAVEWTHDTSRKRWIFKPRADVTLHDGTPWVPAPASLSFPDDQPLNDLLRSLANTKNAIVVRANGALLGTGPFKIDRWQPGKSLTLAAHESYWGGRPFLDQVRITIGRSPKEQALALDLGQADVIEVAPADVRRPPPRGAHLSVSAPIETFALLVNASVPVNVRQALALAIDRAPIHSVLLQKQGEPAGALIPQWISGYAFLFPLARDVSKARELAGGSKPVAFSYDAGDPLLRAIADRIALNASEAGLKLTTTGKPEVALTRLRISVPDFRLTLDRAGTLAETPLPAGDYDAERAIVESGRLIPLFHLPAAYLLGPAVHRWAGAPWVRSDRWRLAEVWVRP